MNRHIVLIVGALFLLAVTAACTSQKSPITTDNAVTVFKSPTCGCCAQYAEYLENKGLEVDVKELPDLSDLKTERGVPANLQSCHTTIIGNYFVEGHVPIEAIEKLIAEKPDIAGIALPGMPSASPGMPGSKRGPFVVYRIGKDGTVAEFLSI